MIDLLQSLTILLLWIWVLLHDRRNRERRITIQNKSRGDGWIMSVTTGSETTEIYKKEAENIDDRGT